MNFDFTEEEQEFARSFQMFCAREIASEDHSFEESGEVPRSIFQKLGKFGFNGLLHQKEYGGQDANYVQTMIAQEILAEHSGSAFFSVGASAGLFGLPISEHGSEEQKSKYLPSIISGEKIGCLAVTEPSCGSDVRGKKSRSHLFCCRSSFQRSESRKTYAKDGSQRFSNRGIIF